MKIANLTQHFATKEQINDGVFDLKSQDISILKSLLTFDEIPTINLMEDRALGIVKLLDSYGVDTAMIAGAPYFMSTLESVLIKNGYKYLYSFSVRISEETLVDGKVIKTNIFKHVGWVG